jgi:hypothetical protein
LNRPEKIYLDDPIFIEGTEINHTLPGLRYLVSHYEGILKNSSRGQLGDKERQHIEKMIVGYKLRIELYEKKP